MLLVDIDMPKACDVCPIRCYATQSKNFLCGDRREEDCPIVAEISYEQSQTVIKNIGGEK